MKQALRTFLQCFFWCTILLVGAGAVSDAWAQTTLVQWNFNTSTTTPSTGTGALSLIGGTTATFSSGVGSTDPATNPDQGWNITSFAAQGTGNKSRGIEIQVNTTQVQSLSISWDQRFSNTAGNRARLQYSTDGITFVDAPFTVTANPGDTWYNANSYDLSAISGLNNNPNARFRIVAEFSIPSDAPTSYTSATPTSAYSATGTWRFDMLTVRGVAAIPQPALTVNPTTLSSFTATQGTASGTQSYTLTGSNLISDITLTASTGVEISTNGTSFSTTAVLTPVNETISQALLARLSASAPSGPVSGTISHSTSGSLPADVTLTGTVSAPLAGRIEITEYMFNGSEFIELTNVGNASVDMTGWSFDDSSRQPGSFPIGSLGTVAPGESVLIAESSAAAFRTNWFLPASVKVVGGNNNNLGGSDEINIYDNNNNLIDRLTYSSGGNVMANGVSAYPTVSNLSSTTAATWQLSAVGDAQTTYVSVDGNIGNPGGYNTPLNRVLVRESGNTTNVIEGGASDTYSIALNSQPTADVVLTIAAGSQLTTTPTTLTFSPTNFSAIQTVSVSAVDDALVEGVHSATIAHSATSPDVAYAGITINPVSVTITDNDVAAGSSPTIAVASTTTAYLSASAMSSVIGDPTDPATTLGIDFTLNDTDTPTGSLSVTASSTNASVVPAANLVLTGSGASRNLKITPTGVGYTSITVTVSDGTNSASYGISYAASAAVTPTSRYHTGASDASTAVDAGEGYMLVADDENQVLRLYNRTNSGLPVAGFDYTSSLGLTDLSGGVPREVDIEASVRVGDRIYWLGSHSNASGGANRPNRSRLFATDVTGIGSSTTLRYVGRYDGLKADLISWDVTNGHGLGANYFGLQASSAPGIAPEADGGTGFNLEGLTVAPDGITGYLSFRAPISPASNRTQALIVPVINFTSLVAGNPASGPATFGAPILLDLGGRGIREIKRNDTGQYLIVAGPSGGAGGDPNAFKLYTWTGQPTAAPVLRTADLSGLSGTNGASSIESIVELPASLDETSVIQLVMDNGDQVYYNDGTIAKELPQNNFKKSRSDYVTLGEALFPDLTLVLYARPTSAYATSPVNLVVDVMELNGVPSNGVITLYITKDPLVSLDLDMTATTVDGRPVQNSSWTFDGSANQDYYVLTTTQRIAGGALLSVGLTGTPSPGATEGRLSLSAVLVGGSGGEVKVTNNTDADKIDYFDK